MFSKLFIVTLAIWSFNVATSNPIEKSNDIVLEALKRGKYELNEYETYFENEIGFSIYQQVENTEELQKELETFFVKFNSGLKNDETKHVNYLQDKYLRMLALENVYLLEVGKMRQQVLQNDVKIISAVKDEFNKFENIFKNYRDESFENECKATLYSTLNIYEENRLVPRILVCTEIFKYSVPTMGSFVESIKLKNDEYFDKTKKSLDECKMDEDFNGCVDKLTQSIDKIGEEYKENARKNHSEFEKTVKEENLNAMNCLEIQRNECESRLNQFNDAFEKC